MKKNCLNCIDRYNCKEYVEATLTLSEYIANLKEIEANHVKILEDMYIELETATEEEAIKIKSEIDILADIIEDCAYHIHYGPNDRSCSRELPF